MANARYRTILILLAAFLAVPKFGSMQMPAAHVATAAAQQASEATTAAAEAIVPQVLMYHLIRDEVYGNFPDLFVRPDDFAAQLALLNAANYRYLYADEYAPQIEPTVILTFDDGYADNYTNLLPLLEKYDACATIFLVTDMVDRPGHLGSEQIKLLSASGRVRFGLHTTAHIDLTTLDEAALREELTRNIADFVRIVGEQPTVMAYPYGRYNARVVEICAEYIDTAYTTAAPPDTPQFTQMTIPRHSVGRETTPEQFRQMVGIA